MTVEFDGRIYEFSARAGKEGYVDVDCDIAEPLPRKEEDDPAAPGDVQPVGSFSFSVGPGDTHTHSARVLDRLERYDAESEKFWRGQDKALTALVKAAK